MRPVSRGWMVGWWMVMASLCGAAAADQPAKIPDDRRSPERAHLLSTVEPQRTEASGPSSRRADDSQMSQLSASQLQGEQDGAVGLEGTRLPPPRAARLPQQTNSLGGHSPRRLAQRTALVLAVFLALVLVQRCWLPRSQPSSCNGLVKVCGKVALDSKQSLHLVRIGQRLLILLESPQGMQCVAEITDPVEVQRLLDGDPSMHDAPSVNVQKVLSTFRQRESSLA